MSIVFLLTFHLPVEPFVLLGIKDLLHQDMVLLIEYASLSVEIVRRHRHDEKNHTDNYVEKEAPEVCHPCSVQGRFQFKRMVADGIEMGLAALQSVMKLALYRPVATEVAVGLLRAPVYHILIVIALVCGIQQQYIQVLPEIDVVLCLVVV